MEAFGVTKLPNTKFRQIVNVKRPDVFEFKKNKLRIYIVFQEPSVYIVMGGYKNTQRKDIASLEQKIKGFKK